MGRVLRRDRNQGIGLPDGGPCDDASSLWPDGSPVRRAASLCIFPSAGPGKTSSMTPWHDCAPCQFLPDRSPSATDPPSGQLNIVANSRQTRSARGTSCLPPAELPPPWPHGRQHRADVAALTPPSSPSIGIWLGPFAFPCPSSLVSTTRTSRFGGFGFSIKPQSTEKMSVAVR